MDKYWKEYHESVEKQLTEYGFLKEEDGSFRHVISEGWADGFGTEIECSVARGKQGGYDLKVSIAGKKWNPLLEKHIKPEKPDGTPETAGPDVPRALGQQMVAFHMLPDIEAVCGLHLDDYFYRVSGKGDPEYSVKKENERIVEDLVRKYHEEYGNRLPMEVYAEKLSGLPAKDGYGQICERSATTMMINDSPAVAMRNIDDHPEIFGDPESNEVFLLMQALSIWDKKPLAFVGNEGALVRSHFSFRTEDEEDIDGMWENDAVEMHLRKNGREYHLIHGIGKHEKTVISASENGRSIVMSARNADIYRTESENSPVNDLTALASGIAIGRATGTAVPADGKIGKGGIKGIEEMFRNALNSVLCRTPAENAIWDIRQETGVSRICLGPYLSGLTSKSSCFSLETNTARYGRRWYEPDGEFASMQTGSLLRLLNFKDRAPSPFLKMSNMFMIKDGRLENWNLWPYRTPVVVSDGRRKVYIDGSSVYAGGKNACRYFGPLEYPDRGWGNFNPASDRRMWKIVRLPDLPETTATLVKSLMDRLPEELLKTKEKPRGGISF